MAQGLNEITGIIVSYNTKQLLKNCIESIRKFYPELKLIIIDGSENTNDCYSYSKSIADKYTKVFNVEYNIGHGKGMKMAIDMCDTKYFVLIDSDTIITKNRIFEVLLKWTQTYNAYGAGKVISTNKQGGNFDGAGCIEYLHPYFCLISTEKYKQYKPIIHHGAPMIDCMIDIIAKEILINVPEIYEYVIHYGRGTRLLNPKEFSPATWERPIS